jgi:hypothetical protein
MLHKGKNHECKMEKLKKKLCAEFVQAGNNRYWETEVIAAC